MEKWIGKVAIVTGANSGIGFGILKKFADAGLIAVGFDINIDNIEKFKSENKSLKVHSKICDVTKDEVTEAAFKWVENQFGGVDVLVNNAGTMKGFGILDHSKPMSELTFNVDLNFTGLIRCSRLAFKSMETRGAYGYIININSIFGHAIPLDGTFQVGVYPGTKFAITASTEVMRLELNLMKNRKVRVTSLSPGSVNTNILNICGITQERKKALLDAPHLNPEDIADSILYLLSIPYHVSIHEITVRATGSDF